MFRLILIALFVSVFTGPQLKAEDESPLEEVKFDPGAFIFDHIADSHEWHLFTIDGKHYTVPLPIIVYTRDNGLNIFMSSRFEHGHAVYRGFKLETKGPEKGNIVVASSDGSIDPDAPKPLDMSITKNVAGMFFAAFVMLAIFITIGKRYRKTPISTPKGIQGLLEPIVIFVKDDIVKPAIGEKKYERYLPYLLTLFFFIWINNMFGLIPIFPMGANVTGNISVTAALALTSFLAINLSGNKIYWQHVFNTPNVPFLLKLPFPIMPIIEIVGLITKPFTLMIRLFANITAGHIITMGFFSLIFIFAEVSPAFGYGGSVLSVAFGIFITFLELLVALIQAYVFTLLTSIFIGAALDDGH